MGFVHATDSTFARTKVSAGGTKLIIFIQVQDDPTDDGKHQSDNKPVHYFVPYLRVAPATAGFTDREVQPC